MHQNALIKGNLGFPDDFPWGELFPATFPRWLSGWSSPALLSNPLLTHPLHARRDRCGVSDHRFSLKTRTLQAAAGRFSVSQFSTLLHKGYLALSKCQMVPRKVVRKNIAVSWFYARFAYAHTKAIKNRPLRSG